MIKKPEGLYSCTVLITGKSPSLQFRAQLSITDKIHHCLVLCTTYKGDMSCSYLESPHSCTQGNKYQKCSAVPAQSYKPCAQHRAQTPWGNATFSTSIPALLRRHHVLTSALGSVDAPRSLWDHPKPHQVHTAVPGRWNRSSLPFICRIQNLQLNGHRTQHE